MPSNENNNSVIHRTIGIISSILKFVGSILILLGLSNVWREAVYAASPILGIGYLCQAYEQWNVNRKSAYLGIVGAAVFFLLTGILLL